jgi:hypothetical protein
MFSFDTTTVLRLLEASGTPGSNGQPTMQAHDD